MIRITELRYKAYFQCLKDVKQLSYGGFSTFDIETSDGLEGNNIFCWSLAYSKGGKRKKLELLTGKSGNFQRLLDLFGSKKHKTRWSKVYAHNMEFDVRHIINYCDKKGIDYNVRRSGSKMICVKIKEFKVMFIDSL